MKINKYSDSAPETPFPSLANIIIAKIALSPLDYDIKSLEQTVGEDLFLKIKEEIENNNYYVKILEENRDDAISAFRQTSKTLFNDDGWFLKDIIRGSKDLDRNIIQKYINYVYNYICEKKEEWLIKKEHIPLPIPLSEFSLFPPQHEINRNEQMYPFEETQKKISRFVGTVSAIHICNNFDSDTLKINLPMTLIKGDEDHMLFAKRDKNWVKATRKTLVEKNAEFFKKELSR